MSQTLRSNIKLLKNFTKPEQHTTIFPNIDIREINDNTEKIIRFQTMIPIIRGDVYLIMYAQEFIEDSTKPTNKKNFLQRVLQEINQLQQMYQIQEIHTENFNIQFYKIQY